MQLTCFARFSVGLALFTGCNERSPTHHGHPHDLYTQLIEEAAKLYGDSVVPYGAPDQRTMFTPDRIAIEKLDGTSSGMPV
jgi:hypothetical protein